jgi:uncharacterized protein (DUF1015 family)
MAAISPFRALRYDPRVVPDLAAVITPPYDVISPAAQARYHARHPYNLIRLILPQAPDAAVSGGDRYAAAADTFAAWQAAGALRRDPSPALYLYAQDFALKDGRRLLRRGILALVHLESYDARVVFPHERTFARHKKDRLRLTRACRAQLEAILGFYPGSAGAVQAALDRGMRGAPQVRVADEEGVEHRLWAITDRAAIVRIVGELRAAPVFIADGHHRYETALRYRAEQQAALGEFAEAAGRRPHDFVLMNLVQADDPGLVILPTHRIVRGRPARTGALLRLALEEDFGVEAVPAAGADAAGAIGRLLDECRRADAVGFGLLDAEGGASFLRVRRAPSTTARRRGDTAALDVALLHRLVIEKAMGIGADGSEGDAVAYTHDAEEAARAVAAGEAAAALFLNPPTVAQVQAVAERGETMPHKSTYFYPKNASGLVMSPLDPTESLPA